MQEGIVAATIHTEIQRRCTQVFVGSEVFVEMNACLDDKLHSCIWVTNFHGQFWDCACAGILVYRLLHFDNPIYEHTYKHITALVDMVKEMGSNEKNFNLQLGRGTEWWKKDKLMAVMDFFFYFSSQNMRSVERRGRISRGWGFICIWPMVERYMGNYLKVVLQGWRRLAKKGLHFSFYDWQFSIFQKAKVYFF